MIGGVEKIFQIASYVALTAIAALIVLVSLGPGWVMLVLVLSVFLYASKEYARERLAGWLIAGHPRAFKIAVIGLSSALWGIIGFALLGVAGLFLGLLLGLFLADYSTRRWRMK